MPTQTYNGWTNYETWNVALWLSNDEGSYNFTREMAAEAENVHDLSIRLEAFVTEGAPDLGASMYADLLGAALSEVSWREIAEDLLSEL